MGPRILSRNTRGLTTPSSETPFVVSFPIVSTDGAKRSTLPSTLPTKERRRKRLALDYSSSSLVFSSRLSSFLLFVVFDARIVVVRSARRNHIQSAFVVLVFFSSFRRDLRLSSRGGVVIRGAKRVRAFDERR